MHPAVIVVVFVVVVVVVGGGGGGGGGGSVSDLVPQHLEATTRSHAVLAADR